jgi:hypothetical protein
MIDDRELIIKFRQIYNEDKTLSHWEATVEFDGERIYEETAVDLPSAGTKIYPRIWNDNSVVPETYKFKKVPEPVIGEEKSPVQFIE